MLTTASITETESPLNSSLPPRVTHAAGGHWMHVVAHLDPQFGGLSAVVPQLVKELTTTGTVSAEIAAFCTPEESIPSLSPRIAVTRWPLSRTSWVRDRTLGTHFRNSVMAADGLHIHGLWEQSTFLAARVARALGKPYVISAHGMLDPWALQNKRVKKLLYGALVERRTVAEAACVHALTEAEAEDYARFGSQSRVAVIPNGVTLPASASGELFLKVFPALRGRRLLLFLGRLHHKKGVELLVRSWAELAAAHPDAHLVLAGPDFEQTQARMERLVEELGMSARVTFTGMLRGELKWSALAAASVFVLPSYSEGFSVSVLEAMGMGVPVIISPACHLPQVGGGFAGWIAQSEPVSLTSSLQEFLSNSPEVNDAMGARGRRLVRERYSWPAIAAQMAEVYRWVASGAGSARRSGGEIGGRR